MTNLDILKKLTGEADESLLIVLLETAESEIIELTGRTRIIPQLEPIVRKWALLAYNRRGMEGEVSRSEGGISASFAEIPKEIDDVIKRYRLARVGGYAHEKKEHQKLFS